MQKLSNEQYKKAANFLKTQAESIDRAMFEYFFEEKSLDEVILVLNGYQNDDGGFGMLDYDIACPVSCMKSTESACRYIYALDKIPADNPLIQRLIPYIISNFNRITMNFNNLVVPIVNEYPHAPWWEYKDTKQFTPKNYKELLDNFVPNTNSALLGMLIKYSSLVPKDISEMALRVVIDKINTFKDFSQYDMLSNIYFVNALTDENLKSDLLYKLMADGKLISLLDDVWGTENAYKLCHWIDSPNHPYYNLYKRSVHNNIKFLINSQNKDGSWSPDWRWGEDKVWQNVEIRLKGLLTYNFLWTLKKFDMIEN